MWRGMCGYKKAKYSVLQMHKDIFLICKMEDVGPPRGCKAQWEGLEWCYKNRGFCLGSCSVILDPPTRALQPWENPHLSSYLYQVKNLKASSFEGKLNYSMEQLFMLVSLHVCLCGGMCVNAMAHGAACSCMSMYMSLLVSACLFTTFKLAFTCAISATFCLY